MDHDPAKSPDSLAGVDSDLSLQRRRTLTRSVVLGGVVLILLAAGFWAVRSWYHRDSSSTQTPLGGNPEDPRLTYTGPFQNIHPDIPYVGDEKCSPCHRDIALSFSRHPMGRSLLPVSRIAAQQRYDAKVNNPFEALGTLMRVERQGERVLLQQIGRDAEGQTVFQLDMPADYVLGSGERGHSYLTDRNGYLFQTPISWYSQKQIWDKSPGFGVEFRSGRPVSDECLFCHANRALPRQGYLNRFEEPVFEGYTIGCERCHGPGGRHIDDPGRKDRETKVDYSIVNPHHLKPELRVAVCEQCHLSGSARVVRRGRGLYDFRPGLPFDAFWSVFVPTTDSPEDRKAVGHVEQMYMSRCFLRSEDKPAEGMRQLGCTTCHDPHQHVEASQRVAHYRKACLECHQEHGCSLPLAARRAKSPQDSCIDCHMPRYPASDIAHTASTDHRLLRRPDGDAPAHGARPAREPEFVSFYRKTQAADDEEMRRDLAVALARIIMQHKAPVEGASRTILRQLEGVVERNPADLDAWEARALALTLLNRPEDALAAYEAVLAQAPHREASLGRAALLAQKLRLVDRAVSYWRRVVEENPNEASYRANLTQILTHQKAWAEARPHCEVWLRLDPSNLEARTLWVSCLLKTGDRDRARAEFAKIERLNPSNLPLLRARFDVELRPR
jgi:Tfp pilus assembly protein PilF